MNTKRACEEAMYKTYSLFIEDIKYISSGGMNIGFIESVRIPAYGQETPIRNVASVTNKNGSLNIEPHDKNLMGVVLAKLESSQISAYQRDKSSIAVNVPKMSSEDKENAVKHIKKLAENAKIAIRNIRRKANKTLDKDVVQELTYHFISTIDKKLQNKISQI